MGNYRIWWSGVANLGAMIDDDAEIQVSCDRCQECRDFTKDDLTALSEKVGRDFSLKNRRCRCRLHPVCDGWNMFFYRRGVYRPLKDPEMTIVRMDRDWAERMKNVETIGRPWPLIDSVPDGMDDLAMCNRYKPGERDTVLNLFDIKKISLFNEGPRIVHPREPGPVVRVEEGVMILEQMTWGFPVVLKGKDGKPLKPRPTNNARFDKLNRFWKRWADFPAQRCLIPTASYAEAVGEIGKKTCTWLSLKSAPVFAWAGLWTVSDE